MVDFVYNSHVENIEKFQSTATTGGLADDKEKMNEKYESLQIDGELENWRETAAKSNKLT